MALTPKAQCELNLIRSSELFDSEWYCNAYPDVPLTGLSPEEHYYRIGAWLGRDPAAGFSTADYLRLYPDVERSGINPLVHFLVHGRQEGRLPKRPAGEVGGADGSSASHPEPKAEIKFLEGKVRRSRHEGRVLLCAHVAGRYLFGGERSLLDLLDGFRESGFEVIVSVPALGNPEYLEALLDRCAGVACFPYGWWRAGVALDEHWTACFSRLISDHQIDAVHANTIMLREPLVAARRMAIPAVVHARELVAHDPALADLIGLDAEMIHSQVLASADWVVANSETTAKAFAAPDKTVVVPNTVDLDALDVPLRSSDGLVNVVMISSNLPKKGLADFVEVARLASSKEPSLRFLLIGPENEHVEQLRAAAEIGSLPSALTLAGYRDSPSAALMDADILVSLSHFQESFGRTVLEAMAASRPVVAYDWGAVPELVEDGRTGFLVQFQDVEGVCEKLCELARSPELRHRLGCAGREAAKARYGKQSFAGKLGAAYRKVQTELAPPVRQVLPARDLPQIQESRLAYFLWHFPVPSETFVLNELRILVELGVDVQVFCKESPHPDFKPDFPIEWTRVRSIDDLAEALLETKRTMVHSHFVYPTVTEMVWPACEKAGIRFTFIAHAQDIFRESNQLVNRVGEVARSAMCLRVFAPSQFHQRFLVEQGVPSAKIFPVSNGIDPTLYQQSSERPTSSPRKRVCAVHRFTEKKGLINLIRAGALLREEGVEIRLYGYGELEEAFSDEIQRLALDNVQLMGPVRSRQDLLQVFSEHDLFACPSVRAADGDMDGIPTVLMEAMAAGLPVLTTSVSGIPDLVKHQITGFVSQPEPEALASAIRELMAAGEDEIAAVVSNATQHVAKHFCVRRSTERMLRLWRGNGVDLLIVSWNNPAQLAEVVRRLQYFTATPFHLVICDNDSQSETLALLSELYASHDNLTIVLNRANAMVGPGTNVCLAHSSSDCAIYVCGKEGFTFRRGWELPLVEFMEDNPDVGLAGTLCYSPTYLRAKDYAEGIRLYPSFRGKSFAQENPERYMSHVQGGLFAIRRKMVDEIGGFSEAVPHDYTDVEFSLHAESCGWRLGQIDSILALYVKTRPGLMDRVTEGNGALHPPRLEDLPFLDRLISGRIFFCPVCKSERPRRRPGDTYTTCNSCGSDPLARAVFHYISNSRLTFRRLPAVAINLPPSLRSFWSQQFQGDIIDLADARAMAADGSSLRFANASLKVLLVPDDEALRPLMTELSRVLAEDAVTIMLPGATSMVQGDCHSALGKFERWTATSEAMGFKAGCLWIGRRQEADTCVC